MFRRSKIILTLGPSLDDVGVCRDVILGGANIFRVNFSHGTHQEHQIRVDRVRNIAREVGLPIGIMADLQGPKIRIGKLKGGSVELHPGQSFFIDTASDNTLGTEKGVSTCYSELVNDVEIGTTILLRDGMLVAEVTAIEQTMIHTEVIVGGILRDHAGLNLKGGGISAAAITDKDIEDAKFSIQLGVDFVALSFVKSIDDIKFIRSFFESNHYPVTLISKIERREALDDIESIVDYSDAIMVARGDLGVEVGYAEVPALQKEMIRVARKYAKPAIVATQILESMCENKVPTRAEVSDIANAVLDGADALMLSAETAVGHNPKAVVEVLHATSLSVEKYMKGKKVVDELIFPKGCPLDVSVALAAIDLSQRVPLAAIVCLTESGKTAFWMSRSYTNMPIIALTPNERSQRRLLLYQGLSSYLFEASSEKSEDLYESIVSFIKEKLSIEVGSYILLTRGQQIGIPGKTNSIRLLEVH